MTTITAFDMKPVESSQIHSFGHDVGSATLAVRFKDKDGNPTTLYYYSKVTAEIWAEMMSDPSPSAYFRTKIKADKEAFPFVRVIEAEAADV